MRIVSVNVGLPREVGWKGRVFRTSIFKEPVAGRVVLRRLNLDGDRQADLRVHGGPEKAVYAYPSEHYGPWQAELPGAALGWGAFGENLTTAGLCEDEVHIGDRFRAGTALLEVTQPRTPCFKLAMRFSRDDILERFLASGRSGFYFRVVEEGEVGAGDAIEVVARDPHGVSVADIMHLHGDDAADGELLRRAAAVPALAAGWRRYFEERLHRLR
jgi:MOSC domain-containing protein YiiM